MGLWSLALRSKRKFAKGGLGPLLNEGANVVAEGEVSRTLVRNLMVKRHGLKSIDRTDLTEITSPGQSRWETFPKCETEEPEIPRKKWIPRNESFNELDRYSSQIPRVFEIRDKKVVHPYGLAVGSNQIIKESLSPHYYNQSRVEKSLAKSIKVHGYRSVSSILTGGKTSSCKELGVAVSLVPLWNNYYHWTVECLPRLAAIERYREESGLQPTIIIPEDPPSWMIESLELLGIDRNSRVFLDDHLLVDRLVVPSYPEPAKVELEWLRDRMSAEISQDVTNCNSRIYISRKNATRRRIRNEEEVVNTLRKYGFEQFTLENLSVEKQVRLLAGAEFVVAPHGAGLVNTVYSRSPVIIELFGESKKTTFYRLAELLGHEYRCLTNREKHSDLVVDVTDLENILNELL